MKPSHLKVRDIDWEGWQPDLTTTLMFVRRQREVLLIRKKTGLGKGKINGPGGKLKAQETPAECAVRETQEELDIVPINPVPRAELFFHAIDFPKLLAFVFVADAFEGCPKESAEAMPLWTPMDALPFDQMWADDEFWLPQVLTDQSLKGWFSFVGDRLIDHEVIEGSVSF